MSVHYKFKSALDFDTITFDGLHISVGDLKKAIIQQKRLGKSADFDLQITNAQTKEEYADDSTLIPKNTSLIIARIPLAIQPKKPWDPQADKHSSSRIVNEPSNAILDISQMNGSEEDKIQAMMIQSTMDYDPNNYQKIRGQGQTGEVPANYRCFKCHKPGHWIKNCPLGLNVEQMEMRRNTGIPRSFIERDAKEKITEHIPEFPVENRQEIPEDLICSICKDLLTDAVMIPCCGSSFCDECVRTALLESEDNECPDCKEKGSSPGLLIPNRFLRNSVNAFRNETGYNKPHQKRDTLKPSTEVTNQQQQQQIATSQEEQEVAEKSSEENVRELTENKMEEDGENNKEDLEMKQKIDVAAHSSHDENESDYEDNITVTVPPAHLQGQRAPFRERLYNGRHSRHIRPPGLENSPKSNLNSQISPSHEMRPSTPMDEGEPMAVVGSEQKSHPMPTHPSGLGQPMMRLIRPTQSDLYGVVQPHSYSQLQSQVQPMMAVPGRPPYDMGMYGGVPPGPGYVSYVRGPSYPILRPGYHPMHQVRPRNVAPMVGNLASVYQGVAAQVGTGIIDDPLEAFNRIMREKEKRKERRRTPDRRRSRSIEGNPSHGRYSPFHTRSHTRTSEERRARSPLLRKRRARSRDKRSSEKERRRHRSSSCSEKSSRSRSWSIPRKRTRSPITFRRRSRSRSASFSVSRSRSRSNSQGRFRGPLSHMRYNRSPVNTMSPRYRQKENRRPDRREDFQREEFRAGPSGHFVQRRPRSRERNPSPNPQFFRQERSFNTNNQDEYFHPHQQQQGPSNIPPPNAGIYNEDYQQYSNRYPPRDIHTSSHRNNTFIGGRERVNVDYNKMDRYDDALPPGTEEPPPPGFENPVLQQREHKDSWGNNQFTDKGYGNNEYRKHDDNQKDYEDLRHTPDVKERQSLEWEERRRYGRDGRSWSKSSLHSSTNANGPPPLRSFEKGSRKSRSRTPIRLEKQSENNSVKERNPNKERYSTKESQGHGASDREKLDYEKKRERDDRDRKHSEHSLKDKKDIDKKSHDKDNRYSIKDDKEKEKHKEHDKEKDKRRDSSEEEKKDKKSKEKRKKKKEKDEKKRIKKEKKEREKKEKEKEREKVKENEKEKDLSNTDSKSNQKIATNSKENVLEKSQGDDKYESENGDKIEQKQEAETNPVGTETRTVFQDKSKVFIENNEQSKIENKEEAEKFELYGDICQEEEIRYDYTSLQKENEVENQKEFDKTTSSTNEARFDSILDIHANLDFEPDLEDLGNNSAEIKKHANILVPLPEPSKWEREDENQNLKEDRGLTTPTENDKDDDDKTSKVTNEVIRRAENAIFTRAISAIRPIEIKKISVERQKLYANEPTNEDSSTSIATKSSSPKSELQSFQITVPTNQNSERSVEIKQDQKSKKSPIRSVRDRLGSKISDPLPQKRMRSRSASPPRKMHTDGGREREKPRQARSRSKDYRKDDSRDIKRDLDNKRFHENSLRSRERDRMQKDFKMNDYRNRDQHQQFRLRDNDRRRDFNKDRKKDKFREQDRIWDRDRDKEKDNPRFRNKSGYDNERFGIRDQERNRERENKEINSIKDFHKKRDQREQRGRDSHEKRERSRSSKSSEKSHKKEKTERQGREAKNKHSEERIPRPPETEIKNKDDKDNHKEIDQAHTAFSIETNNDQNAEISSIGGGNKSTNENLKKPEKSSKSKNQISNKRSRTKSTSSSSSSSSEYESDSESEENKKKKKKKHKREKKRSRRSSSIDSLTSTKHKRSKSKKKKSSKKKKKSKK